MPGACEDGRGPFTLPSPIAMAHRGGADYAPNAGIENTRTAFAKAVDLGYEWLETDIHASRDGVVFAFHDPRLDRMCDLTGPITAYTAEEVRRARVAGSEHIPSLEELLEAFPGTRFNIDVKEAGAIRPLAELLDRTGAHQRVCIASFSYARIKAVRAVLGDSVATSLSGPEVALLRLGPVPALRRLAVAGGAVAAQVPARAGPLPVVTAGFLRNAHALGLQVHVWTVDEPDEMNRLLDLGVDGIISDRIDVLKDVLTARGQWRGGPDQVGDR